MPAKLEIRWWNGRVVGHLLNRGSNFFAYDPAWLELGHNLSPLKLPFTAAVYNAGKEEDGLPGLLADCLPDAWGRKVAALHFAAQKLGGKPARLARLKRPRRAADPSGTRR